MEAFARSTTPEEARAAFAEIERWHARNGRSSATMGSDAKRERVTPEEARSWWTQGNLLQPMVRNAQEVAFIDVITDGRRPDQNSGLAGVTFVYQFPPATVDTATYYEILAGGGVVIQALYVPPTTPEYSAVLPGENPTPVVVRGRAATMVSRTPPKFNVSFRQIAWREPVERGGFVDWRFATGIPQFSDAEAVAMVDGAKEI